MTRQILIPSLSVKYSKNILEEVPPAALVDQILACGGGSSCYLIAISANAGWMDLDPIVVRQGTLVHVKQGNFSSWHNKVIDDH